VGRLIVGALLVALTEPALVAEPRAWVVDYGASRIEFVAEQAGAKFRGRFERFEADIRFDPAALEASHALVKVDVRSISTLDEERDAILEGAGWFESDAFPEATFEATTFEAVDGGFDADGVLTVRDESVPVAFHFTLTDTGLEGYAELDRIALGLGLGEWADSEWIGHRVRVEAVVTGTAVRRAR